jgi:hypothetical protein
MKKAFSIILIAVGLVFLTGGIYAVARGLDAKAQVHDELAAQNIVTTEDASIPNEPVVNAATATSMADIIQKHALEATGGETYAEMGRFLAKDGGATSDEAEAMLDDEGNPVPNPLRNVAFQAAALRTSLYASVLAFNVADLVTGLGAAIAILGFVIAGVGVALSGLFTAVAGLQARSTPTVAVRAA